MACARRRLAEPPKELRDNNTMDEKEIDEIVHALEVALPLEKMAQAFPKLLGRSCHPFALVVYMRQALANGVCVLSKCWEVTPSFWPR